MSESLKLGGYECVSYPGAGDHASCILVINMVEHPFGLQPIVAGLAADVLSVTIPDWDDALTPWVAPGLYAGDADFGGDAASTLKSIETGILPRLRNEIGEPYAHMAIAGYSLGGLFSLYSFANSPFFCAVASMSGSVWYEGWLSYLQDAKRAMQGTFAYLSIGDRENRAREQILHCVIDNTKETAEILQRKGSTVEFHEEKGSHFDDVPQRVQHGLQAVDRWLSRL